MSGISILPLPRNPSGFDRGDKGFYKEKDNDHHAIIIIGENDTHIHAIYLMSGAYVAIPKDREYTRQIFITRPRFWGNFIKPRKR